MPTCLTVNAACVKTVIVVDKTKEESDMKFPRTIAAVQKRDRCMWEIGDALIAECGAPPADGAKDGTYRRLEQAAQALEKLQLTEHSVKTLANIRRIAFAFPKRSRRKFLGLERS